MKIEQQCITLEQAKKLKELGITSPSIMKWYNSSVGVVLLHNVHGEQYLENEWYAFTVAELGVMLPDYFKENDQQFPFKEYYSHTNKNMWKFNNFFTGYNSSKIVVDASTEAEARAVMLIYLLENKHIAAEECNARLTA